jgi:hypothetical protein
LHGFDTLSIVVNNPAEVTLLREEAQLTATTSQQRYGAFGQFGSLGVAIVVASASFATGSTREIILLAAPPVLSLIFTIMLQHLSDASILNNYHGKIQARLSVDLPVENQLRYAAILTRRPYWSVLPARLLVSLIVVGSFVLSGVTAYHASSYRGLIVIYFWISVLLSLAALISGLLDLVSSRARTDAILEK